MTYIETARMTTTQHHQQPHRPAPRSEVHYLIDSPSLAWYSVHAVADQWFQTTAEGQ